MRDAGGSAPLIFHKSPALIAGAGSAATREPSTSRPVRESKKNYVRRRGDRSQRIRLLVQLAFAATTVAVGVQFYLWVRYFETGGATMKASRPPGVEAWLPIAALMNLKDFLLTRTVPEIHPAGMFMLIAFVAVSWMYRKAFCSWVCPVGTMSEWLWKCGEATFGRTFALPRWFDISLRSLKYVLFGLFLYVVVTMPVPEIREFLGSPYGIVADVKMLDFFRRMGQSTAIVLAVLVVLSLVVRNFWCRYLCPYGAMLGLVALVSPTRIRRDPDACIDCAKCAKACPAGLPVDTALSIRSAECTACMSCVAVCPAVGALDLTTGSAKRHTAVAPWALAAGIAVVFIGLVGYARAAGYWHTPIADETYKGLIPHAAEFEHPR
jgi:polyferredoxin